MYLLKVAHCIECTDRLFFLDNLARQQVVCCKQNMIEPLQHYDIYCAHVVAVTIPMLSLFSRFFRLFFGAPNNSMQSDVSDRHRFLSSVAREIFGDFRNSVADVVAL